MSRWLHQAVPASRVAAVRLVVGSWATLYLVVRAAHLASLARLPDGHWAPVGLARLLPHDRVTPGVVWVACVLTIAAGLAFTLGWRHRITGPVFALGLLALTSFRNSFGQVFHTEHLLVLHVLVLALASEAVATGSLDARRDRSWSRRVDGWPVRLMAVVTVLTYVIAGVAKLRSAGTSWVDGATLRHWIAYDNLRKIELGDVHSPLGGWLVGHGWVFVPLAVATLVVELGAPIALLGGRWARRWAAAAWLFHVGVLAVMAIVFPYPLTGAAYVCLVQAERLPGARRVIGWFGPGTVDLTSTETTVSTYIRT